MNRGIVHRQVWVKTNTQVDEGIADVVLLLNSIPHLITIESCQGHNEWAWVTFWYGDWKKLCSFLFQKLAPVLNDEFGEDVSLNATLFGHDIPQGEIRFRVDARDRIASTLKKILYPP